MQSRFCVFHLRLRAAHFWLIICFSAFYHNILGHWLGANPLGAPSPYPSAIQRQNFAFPGQSKFNAITLGIFIVDSTFQPLLLACVSLSSLARTTNSPTLNLLEDYLPNNVPPLIQGQQYSIRTVLVSRKGLH